MHPHRLQRARLLAHVQASDSCRTRTERVQPALDVDTACFGHGDAVVAGAGERLRVLA